MVIPAQDVYAFIRASFRSVWALEVLCYLRAERERSVAPQSLVETLRASSLVIEQSFANLVSAGLVVRDEQGNARYVPASAELDEMVAACEALYGTSPARVRRTIIEATAPGIAAFADAFKLKDK